MRDLRLAQLSWTEVEGLGGTKALAILPIGATEPYGPHLPLSTDGLVAEWIALRVAERAGGIVAPLIPIGNSALFADFPGTLSIRDETIHELLRNMGSGLHSAGFKRLLVVNGHAGNSPSVSRYLAEEGCTYFRPAVQTDVWRLAEALGHDLFAGVTGAFAHAGPCATSIMLCVAPDLVRQEPLAGMAPVSPRWPPGISVPVPFRILYPEGYGGDVAQASSEKGKILLERMVRQIVSAVEDACRLAEKG